MPVEGSREMRERERELIMNQSTHTHEGQRERHCLCGKPGGPSKAVWGKRGKTKLTPCHLEVDPEDAHIHENVRVKGWQELYGAQREVVAVCITTKLGDAFIAVCVRPRRHITYILLLLNAQRANESQWGHHAKVQGKACESLCAGRCRTQRESGCCCMTG